MFGQKGKLTSGKPVRICADSVAAAYLLPKPLSMITGSNPDIVFDLTQARTRKPILEAADSEEVPGTHFGTPEDADVEISASPSPETIDFEGESKLIGVMEAIVIASPANRSVNAAAVSEEDTEATAKPFSTIAGIHISNKFAVWSGYSSLLTPDLEARTALTSDSIEAIKSVVEESASASSRPLASDRNSPAADSSRCRSDCRDSRSTSISIPFRNLQDATSASS